MTNDTPPGRRPPEADEVEKLRRQVSDMMQKEFGDAARLMAQPIAGAAALSALGFGMATQAFGLWLTAVSGAMRAGHEIAHAGRHNPSDKAAAAGDGNAAGFRAKASAEAVITEAKAAAGTGAEVVKFVSKAERAAKVAKPSRRKAISVAASAPVARPSAQARPVATDDLKAIGGIGPKLEAVLNGFGIRTYAQIAALTADEIGRIEGDLGFKGRIGRDDWIGQAKALMSGGRA